MPKLPNTAGAFMGFDVGSFPGLDFMQDWSNNSPYQFVGYYLLAPCHGTNFTPWEGNRAALAAMGWTFIVIYVGQQRPPDEGQSGCSQNNLTSAQGTADAIDAGQRTTNEGFSAGSFIYLDIETGDPFGSDLSDYLTGWVQQILIDGFGVGIYCSRNIANDVNNFIQGLVTTPRIWVFGDSAPPNEKFNRDTSAPSDSTVSSATAWQSLPHSETFGSSTLTVDESVTTLADPSDPNATETMLSTY